MDPATWFTIISAAISLFQAVKKKSEESRAGGKGVPPAPSLADTMASLGRPQGQNKEQEPLLPRSAGIGMGADQNQFSDLIMQILNEGGMPSRAGGSPLSF